MFSTKGSESVKDNIANIFGAKTLSAIIPLDLKLELQPTTSQILRDNHTQPGSASSEVKVAGYVSRPVFGEGRSTPDRQMFFVNSRPCNLPQIAKAMNEVYKSYNITQSPFIFANLEMDTHAYDVNVSPDKRTILLHDQHTLLESLKESLIKLFDAQNQTVPQSQLPANKLPLFRQLTIRKDGSQDLEVEDDQEEGVESGRPDLQSSINEEPSSGAPSTDDAPNLLQKFIGRNLEDRAEVQAKAAKDKEGFKVPHMRLSRPRGPARTAFVGEEPVSDVDVDGDADVDVNVDEENEARPNTATKRAVQEFNARWASQEQKSGRRSVEIADEDGGDRNDNGISETDAALSSDDDSTEQPEEVGTKPTSTGNSSTTANSAYDRLLRKRSAVDVQPTAVTSWTASATPLSKRMKINRPSPSTQIPLAESRASQFSRRMHSFAAPGTQASVAGDLEAVDLEMDQSAESASEDDPEDEWGDTQRSTDSRDAEEDDSQDEYIDEDERRKRDEERVQDMVRKAEVEAALPTQTQEKRANAILKSKPGIDSTVALVRILETSSARIESQLLALNAAMEAFRKKRASTPDDDDLAASRTSPEERLSLIISKSDFADMRIVGQFNLGFILATRSANHSSENSKHSDELFIIDQHASDEIYNFHRLSASTTLTPQPLVRPHNLELTAVEEETVLTHANTLAKNGFNISVDESGDSPVGQRCQLLTLPTSRETVFDTRDLEELISLLAEANPFADDIVRPSRVRKMLAMRACRSSIMVGKTLTRKGMEGVVRHMGEIDKPWNCPHGRPTMRHLASLGQWGGWSEGDGLADDEIDGNGTTDWSAFVQTVRQAGLMEGKEEDHESEEERDGSDGEDEEREEAGSGSEADGDPNEEDSNGDDVEGGRSNGR